MNIIRVILIFHILSIISFICGAFLFFKNNNTINHAKLLRIQVMSLVIWIIGPILLFNQKNVELELLNTLGLILQLVSLLLFIYLVSSIGRGNFLVAGSDDEPLNFYNTGPFRYIRHPFYFSYLANYLGIFLSTLNSVYLIMIIIITYFYVLMATEEENFFLKSKYKNDYKIYMSKTNQIIPLVKSFKQLFSKG